MQPFRGLENLPDNENVSNPLIRRNAALKQQVVKLQINLARMVDSLNNSRLSKLQTEQCCANQLKEERRKYLRYRADDKRQFEEIVSNMKITTADACDQLFAARREISKLTEMVCALGLESIKLTQQLEAATASNNNSNPKPDNSEETSTSQPAEDPTDA